MSANLSPDSMHKIFAKAENLSFYAVTLTRERMRTGHDFEFHNVERHSAKLWSETYHKKPSFPSPAWNHETGRAKMLLSMPKGVDNVSHCSARILWKVMDRSSAIFNGLINEIGTRYMY